MDKNTNKIDDLTAEIACALQSSYNIEKKKSKVKKDLAKSFLIVSLISLVISVITTMLTFNVLGVVPALKLIVSNVGYLFASQLTVVAGVHAIAFLANDIISKHLLRLRHTQLNDSILELQRTTDSAKITKKMKINTSEIVYGNTSLDVTLKKLEKAEANGLLITSYECIKKGLEKTILAEKRKAKTNRKEKRKQYLKSFPALYAIGLIFCATIINFLGTGTALAHSAAAFFAIAGGYLITAPILYANYKNIKNYINDKKQSPLNEYIEKEAEATIEMQNLVEKTEQLCEDFSKDFTAEQVNSFVSATHEKISFLKDYRSGIMENYVSQSDKEFEETIKKIRSIQR